MRSFTPISFLALAATISLSGASYVQPRGLDNHLLRRALVERYADAYAAAYPEPFFELEEDYGSPHLSARDALFDYDDEYAGLYRRLLFARVEGVGGAAGADAIHQGETKKQDGEFKKPALPASAIRKPDSAPASGKRKADALDSTTQNTRAGGFKSRVQDRTIMPANGGKKIKLDTAEIEKNAHAEIVGSPTEMSPTDSQRIDAAREHRPASPKSPKK